MAPWLITTPAWAALTAHLAAAALRRAGDPTVVAVAAAWVATCAVTCALTFLLVTRARPGAGDRST